MKRAILMTIVLVLLAPQAYAAGAAQLGAVMKRTQQMRDVQMTDQEEQQLGEAVSEKIRVRYGVVQDAAIHKYVSLVGTVLAQAGSRPNLPYRFVVLDTDGVNAFAAPGGYVHITRGALALVTSEGELAGVLAHEIIHVTEKHTIRAIQKGKLVQMGADETVAGNTALFSQLVDKATEVVLAGFGRAEELEADEKGLVLANKIGYAPQGLSTFLNVLLERNKSTTEKQGLFASHPEMQERLQRITKQIAAQKLMASITLEDRYRKFVSYKPTPQVSIPQAEAGQAGTASSPADPKSTEKPAGEQTKKPGFGLSSLAKPGGTEKPSAEVTGSGASRGVDTERNARGGPVSKPVTVALTPADITAFKKEGNLS